MRRLRYRNFGAGAAQRWLETASPSGSKSVDLPDGTVLVPRDDALAAIEREQKVAHRIGELAERDRLRKEVEGLVGFWDNHPSKRLDGPERRLVNEIFDEVLALLDKPIEERS